MHFLPIFEGVIANQLVDVEILFDLGKDFVASHNHAKI